MGIVEGAAFDRMEVTLGAAAAEGVYREATGPAGLWGKFYPTPSATTPGTTTSTTGVLVFQGYFDDVPSLSGQAWSSGAKLYWNATANVARSNATANQLIGIAGAAKVSGTVVCTVLANGLTGLM